MADVMSRFSWRVLAMPLLLLAAAAVASAQVDEGSLPISAAQFSEVENSEGLEGEGDWGGWGRFGGGNVYTMSNAADGNEIIVFRRHGAGRLMFDTTYPTGGMGTGAGLGNQGGLVMSEDGRWLLAVNAGSDELSVFRVTRHYLVLTDVEPSGGDLPISVTIHGHLVYVLHGAEAGSINGFTLDWHGKLTPLAGSERPLSGGNPAGPAQISFSPGGDVLVVTEKPSNLLTTYTIDAQGLPGMPMPQASAGDTPFGFAFTRSGLLIVSEAFGGMMDQSAVSSYDVDSQGMLGVISASVPTTETAACWIALSRDDRFAYIQRTPAAAPSRATRSTSTPVS